MDKRQMQDAMFEYEAVRAASGIVGLILLGAIGGAVYLVGWMVGLWA